MNFGVWGGKVVMVFAREAVVGKLYLSPRGCRVKVLSVDLKKDLVVLKWFSDWGLEGKVAVNGGLLLTEPKR